MTSNPLLSDWTGAHGLPEFSVATPDRFRPAFDEALAAHRAEIDAIAAGPAPATFANTIEALEKSGRALDRVSNVFFVLAGADTSDEIEAVERDISPLLARHSNAMYLNRALFARIADLWARRDTLGLNAEQARVLERYHTRFVRAGAALDKAAQGDDMKPRRAGAGGPVQQMRLVARGAAKLMAADDGPRIAALAFDGWDTHANEGGPVGRLANLLSGLDGALAEFESGLGAHWRDTVVVVATEFGRTVRINGTEGTDHGTGTIALLAGGAVKGGRVIANWPTLKSTSLYEGRDLAPTTDLRAVIKGVLSDHLGISENVLASSVFPDSASAKPMRGLIV